MKTGHHDRGFWRLKDDHLFSNIGDQLSGTMLVGVMISCMDKPKRPNSLLIPKSWLGQQVSDRFCICIYRKTVQQDCKCGGLENGQKF